MTITNEYLTAVALTGNMGCRDLKDRATALLQQFIVARDISMDLRREYETLIHVAAQSRYHPWAKVVQRAEETGDAEHPLLRKDESWFVEALKAPREEDNA